MAPTWMFALYFGCQLCSAVLCSILLATLMTSRVQRHATVQNFFLVLIITSIIYCLLLFSDNVSDYKDPPSETYCLVTGSLVMACPPAQGLACMCLVTNIFLRMLSVHRSRAVQPSRSGKILSYSSLSLPWVVFLLLFCVNLGSGLSASERKHIQRQTFYCTVGGRTLSLINLIPAAMSAIVTILIVFTLAVLLCLIRRRSSPLGTARRVDMEFAMRCIPFGAYLLASASIAIVYIDDFAAPTPDLFVCTIPIAAVLVFGTQRDVLRFWGSVFGRTIFATTHSPGNVPLPMSLATNKSPRKPKGNGHHLETSFGNLDPALSVDYAVHEICDTFHIQHTGHNVTAFDMEDGKFEGLSDHDIPREHENIKDNYEASIRTADLGEREQSGPSLICLLARSRGSPLKSSNVAAAFDLSQADLTKPEKSLKNDWRLKKSRSRSFFDF